MVYRQSMGVEPASGIGASALPDSHTHDRICSCSPAASRTGGHTSLLLPAPLRVWVTSQRHLLENGAFFWPRLSPPGRWDVVLSSGKVSPSPGAASRGRWESARGVCSQHSPLPPVSTARAVSMEWRCSHEATAGQCPSASARGWEEPAPLARLEPQRTPTGLHAARAPPTHRGESPTVCPRFAITSSGRDPLSCTTCALASLVGRAARSQYRPSNGWASHHQALWHSSILCCFDRVGDSLILRFSATGFLLLGPLCCSEGHLMAFFPGFSSSSAIWLLLPLILLSHGPTRQI